MRHRGCASYAGTVESPACSGARHDRRLSPTLRYLPQTLAADTTYGNGELLQWLEERGITAYIRVKENPNGPTGLYGIDQFTYVPEENSYICPEGKPLKYVGINPLNHTHLYYSTLFDGEVLP